MRNETDFDRQELAEWGLDCYLERIASGLGVGLESVCCEAVEPATAYLALDQRLPHTPGRGFALLWETGHGWQAGTETGLGDEFRLVAYLGGTRLLASPQTVVAFAQDLLAGHHAGQHQPPQLPCGDLTDQLAAYVPAPAPQRPQGRPVPRRGSSGPPAGAVLRNSPDEPQTNTPAPADRARSAGAGAGRLRHAATVVSVLCVLTVLCAGRVAIPRAVACYRAGSARANTTPRCGQPGAPVIGRRPCSPRVERPHE